MRHALIPLLALALLVRAEPPKSPPDPPARAPLAGQVFDDREIIGHLEAEGRKLLAAKRVNPIKAAPRRCALTLAETGREKSTLASLAANAEAATVVLGEFFTEGKNRELKFASAAGGFFVGARGTLVTSLHVIGEKDSRGFVAMTRDGRVFPVREALAVDEVEDLAVLQLDAPDDMVFPTLRLAATAAPAGTPIAVMSHPDEHFWMLTTGIVARNTVWRGERGDEHYTCITADFAKGSSGCPVLDESGDVVAIVNNTVSLYYDDNGRKKQLDLQMVIKNTTPGWIARTLFAEPGR
ncbi:MAG: serine protease [Chthoniobacteraceae bacterium]